MPLVAIHNIQQSPSVLSAVLHCYRKYVFSQRKKNSMTTAELKSSWGLVISKETLKGQLVPCTTYTLSLYILRNLNMTLTAARCTLSVVQAALFRKSPSIEESLSGVETGFDERALRTELLLETGATGSGELNIASLVTPAASSTASNTSNTSSSSSTGPSTVTRSSSDPTHTSTGPNIFTASNVKMLIDDIHAMREELKYLSTFLTRGARGRNKTAESVLQLATANNKEEQDKLLKEIAGPLQNKRVLKIPSSEQLTKKQKRSDGINIDSTSHSDAKSKPQADHVQPETTAPMEDSSLGHDHTPLTQELHVAHLTPPSATRTFSWNRIKDTSSAAAAAASSSSSTRNTEPAAAAINSQARPTLLDTALATSGNSRRGPVRQPKRNP